jgi:hypothetical protein
MSEKEERDITYNSALEKLIAEEAEKCSGYSWLHEHSERYYNIRNTAVTLPTIVLSTLVGFLSGSSSSIFTEATMASIGIGSVSLFTGVLSTIGTFFSFSKKAEGHRIASIQYGKLSRFLAIELTLPRDERIRACDLLKITKEHIERLMETSPPVPSSIISQFNSKFRNEREVAKPAIVNGIHKVEINSKVINIQTPPAVSTQEP